MTAEEFAGYAKRYGDTVYRVALNCCKNAADAEDIMQTVLLKLYREKTEFESDEHVKRWIIRVAVNEGRKLRSSGWFKRRVSLEEYAGTVDFESREDSELFIIVMGLPEKYRVPLYLYYYEELTTQEIADALGRSPSTVRTQLSRAREQLKSLLLEERSDA